jgi:hypothetical protein
MAEIEAAATSARGRQEVLGRFILISDIRGQALPPYLDC